MSKAASKPKLEALHDALAEVLAKAVGETEVKIVEIPDAEAEGGKRKIAVTSRNAAILNAARQFLKDNGIECAPGFPSEGVKNLAGAVKTLPFPSHPGGDDEDDALRH